MEYVDYGVFIIMEVIGRKLRSLDFRYGIMGWSWIMRNLKRGWRMGFGMRSRR